MATLRAVSANASVPRSSIAPKRSGRASAMRGGGGGASASAFDALERSGWELVAAPYERFFGGLTSQCVEALLDDAGVGPGSRTLDVATGHGVVAAAAFARGAETTALDFSGAFLRRAREVLPAGVALVEGDAQELPFPDASFDAVVCNFGVLHLSRPDAFFAEARRVLAPGGALAFTAWCAPPAAEPFALVLDAVRECGDPDVALPEGPPFFRYAHPAASAEALAASGFEEPRLRVVPQTLRLGAAEELFELFAQGTVRTRALIAAQTPEARAAVAGRLARAAVEAGLVLEAPAALSSARAPKP